MFLLILIQLKNVMLLKAQSQTGTGHMLEKCHLPALGGLARKQSIARPSLKRVCFNRCRFNGGYRFQAGLHLYRLSGCDYLGRGNQRRKNRLTLNVKSQKLST